MVNVIQISSCEEVMLKIGWKNKSIFLKQVYDCISNVSGQLKDVIVGHRQTMVEKYIHKFPLSCLTMNKKTQVKW